MKNKTRVKKQKEPIVFITKKELDEGKKTKALVGSFAGKIDNLEEELAQVKTSRDDLQRRVAGLSRGNNIAVASNKRLKQAIKDQKAHIKGLESAEKNLILKLEDKDWELKEAIRLRDYQSKRADDADKVAEMYGKESIELRATLHRIAFPAKKLAEFIDWFRKLSLFKRLKFAIYPNDYSILDYATSDAETIFALTKQEEL